MSSDEKDDFKIDWESTEKPFRRNTDSDDYTCKLSSAFDHYFACLTVGKQLSNYYRYGEKRPCTKHWQNVKLCMKVKLLSKESGKKLMREYDEKQETERSSKPNVLDIWTRRSPDNPAFPDSADSDTPPVQDEHKSTVF
ncbi:hypothetical protein GGI25_001836 [Coemansia spiralis]|uniref:Uncharacterized protein n=2 Tax=Coemansia TaxID=4863 RepID=A0A9W8G9W6_9FUNG|nr:hypothetical protein BX070DRAFT_150120 [Coemansia spiralis]KAJ1993958.1 hypothetical protein EDC05_001869 [Coemansia umbellata]KAJ2622723.1 hypothetical protein GGI26_002992 [Coemansia sp. RSA 1358]KAJ2679064.1 hypothetical protein GGI25_001836 [Coemansia spiralis]